MCSMEEYVNFMDGNNECLLDCIPGATLGNYIDNNSLSVPHEDPVFYCRAQDKYLHRESILDPSLLQPGEFVANIEAMDSVEINVELYNNENGKGVVIISNGSDTFGDIKDNCERALLLVNGMSIIGWKVDDQDVDASDKVFDHITSSGHSIVAVIELLQNR